MRIDIKNDEGCWSLKGHILFYRNLEYGDIDNPQNDKQMVAALYDLHQITDAMLSGDVIYWRGEPIAQVVGYQVLPLKE